MSKRLFLKKWHYTYQIPSPEIELILQADRERKERLQIDYGMKPPKFEQLFEGGNLYKVYSYFYYFIFYFDYEGRSFHSYLNPFKKYLFNKELLKQDFFKGYKQGTKYFEDNYLTNREGVYSNTEPIITQLKYLLNEWKGVNNSTTINELKYPDYPTHYSLGNFVRIAHNRMITSRTVLTYGFYSGFYARLVEMVESYSGLLGTMESLENTTTIPITADTKPNQTALAYLLLETYPEESASSLAKKYGKKAGYEGEKNGYQSFRVKFGLFKTEGIFTEKAEKNKDKINPTHLREAKKWLENNDN